MPVSCITIPGPFLIKPSQIRACLADRCINDWKGRLNVNETKRVRQSRSLSPGKSTYEYKIALFFCSCIVTYASVQGEVTPQHQLLLQTTGSYTCGYTARKINRESSTVQHNVGTRYCYAINYYLTCRLGHPQVVRPGSVSPVVLHHFPVSTGAFGGISPPSERS